MTTYDAFISYSHAKDKPIAAALQVGDAEARQAVVPAPGAARLSRRHQPVGDAAACGPRSSRRSSQSRYLVLLASPEAAASPWVSKEVAYWLEHKSVDTLLIAVTDGELAWDDAVGDFDWRERIAVAAGAPGRFASEPKWVDLTRLPRRRRYA